MIGLAAALILVLMAGLPLAVCVTSTRIWSDRLVRPVIACAIGGGLCSCVFFLSLAAFRAPHPWLFAELLVGMIALKGVQLWRGRARCDPHGTRHAQMASRCHRLSRNGRRRPGVRRQHGDAVGSRCRP